MKFKSTVNVIALSAKVATGIIPNPYLQILSQNSVDILQEKLDKLPYGFPPALFQALAGRIACHCIHTQF